MNVHPNNPELLSPMSSEPVQPSPAQFDPLAEIAHLKRRLAASQEDVLELSSKKPKKSGTTITLGRGIRRLVSLYDSLNDLLQAADDHNANKDQVAVGSEPPTKEEREKQQESAIRFASFKILLQTIPSVGTVIADPAADVDVYLAQLQKGANDARSDDVRRVKEELALWLNAEYAPSPPFDVKSRSDRGKHNNITARLLCPIEYDWNDEEVCNGIRNGTIDISEDYFLRCFYPHGKGDPDNIEKGFLRSCLLVKTFSTIFISPSSSEAFVDEDENGAARKKPRLPSGSRKKATKCNVATILGMDSRVTPRSIAYSTVLLAFNLTNASHWTEVYNCFDYRALYALVIDFFEAPTDPLSKKRSNDLLKWWNVQIFPHYKGTSTNTRKSRKRLAAQRAAQQERSLPV